MKNFLKKLFCQHKDNEVIRWRWVHDFRDHSLFMAVRTRCNNCGKCGYRCITDPKEWEEFKSKYADKQWFYDSKTEF